MCEDASESLFRRRSEPPTAASVGVVYLVEGAVGLFSFPLCSGGNPRFGCLGSDDGDVPMLFPPWGHHFWSHTLA